MELNYQAFQETYSFLHSRDDGLVCSFRCNTNTVNETSFQFYYILRPSSDNRVMLLRKLAGLEEALDVRDSIKSFLLEIEERDYNPIQHKIGFPNVLMEESLHFGSPPELLNESGPSQLPAH